MKTTLNSWGWRWYAGRVAALLAAGCFAVFTVDPTFAQRDRGGGGNDRGGGGRAQGGGQGGGNVRAGGQAGGAAGVQGGGQAGAQVRVPQASGGAQVRTPPAIGGAQIRTPAVSGGAQSRLPTASGGAQVGTPAVTGDAQVRTPQAGADARVRTPGANLGATADIPGATGRATVQGSAAGRATINTPSVDARTNIEGQARTALRPDIDNVEGRVRTDARADARADSRADGRADANSNFRARWDNATPAQRQAFRSGFNQALNVRAANRAAMSGWLDANPARATYYSNWGGSVRNGFVYGPGGVPFYGNNFWSTRNLIGLGLSAAGVGGGGYYAPGGWWGYSPWLGSRPYGYWYGNPGWNTFAGYYGWNSPYFYDYGPYGNVVYRGNTVYVNDQLVGTATDYATSAAELAMVTEEQMNAAHEWAPLGTFSMAINQNESNPARVLQIAHDNKQGLISGTIFNRESGNLYTVQGKVDPQTQRVAFTIGKDPNVVFETGLYNLTQQETPLLVHFGSNKTDTYLLARLAEPKEGDQATTATAPAGQPVEDLRR